jgi:3-phosphoshikimate 1-carboxyvinyltransferase
MSLAVLCTLTGGMIEGAEAVAKSYPEFFEDLEALGINRRILND